MSIMKFEGEHRFLSNFWPCQVWVDDKLFLSVEAAYQAQKSPLSAVRERFTTMSASKAKQAGKQIRLRRDWDDVKLGIMLDLVQQKFSDPDLAASLIRTAPHELFEGNTWGDRYWGVCKGEGSNWLGRILMIVRSEYIARRNTQLIKE